MRSERFDVVVEGIDARQSLADSGTPINTKTVDSAHLLLGPSQTNGIDGTQP